MSDCHPKSAYAELLSLREWVVNGLLFDFNEYLTCNKVADEIDRRLATADRGEVERDGITPEEVDDIVERVREDVAGTDREMKPSREGGECLDTYMRRGWPVDRGPTPLEAAVFELCRRALGGDQ